MIVVVSDLHLTDGASGTSVESGAFNLFARLVGDLARHASHRAGGFRPLEDGLDLVLLGDVLDFLRSDGWPPRSGIGGRPPRPWEPAEVIAPTVARITERILERNAAGIESLRRLAAEGALIYEDGETFRVPVRVTYFVGNHDWLLHLPGEPYDRVRQRVVETLGLVNDPRLPFPHDIEEAPSALAERLRRHGLVVRHGDIHDRFNYVGDRNRSAIGDGVVIELLNRFPTAVREELELGEDHPLYLALREVDNVRPFTLIPPYVLGVIRRFELEDRPQGRAVLDTWNRLAEEFFALDFVRERDSTWRWDEVDRLELLFRFVRGFTSGGAARAVAGQLLRMVRGHHRRFAHRALLEPEVVMGRARYVVYGHTHLHEIRPLAALRPPTRGAAALARAAGGAPASAGGKTRVEPVSSVAEKQFYLNSGTWRPTYKQTLGNPERLEFLGHNALTVLAFYAGDERGGRGFEAWSGALAGPS